MASAAVEPVVRDIEEAFVAQWSLLGAGPGGRLVDERGALRFETPLRKLPYNGVIRTTIDGDPEDVVATVAGAYRERGADFMWIVHPSARPADLRDLLAGAGLTLVETAHGMALDLDGWEPQGRAPRRSVDIEEVVDEEGLRAYADLVVSYWELDAADRVEVARMHRYWAAEGTKGHRWLARAGGRPVAKAYLSVAGPPAVGAIYGMSVRPEARGLGIAGALTDALLAQAGSLGCRRVVLHSTDMAAGIYRRAGFVEHCTLDVFATARLWSGKH